MTGEGDDIIEVIGDGDAFSALLWGSMLAVLVAALLSVSQRLLTIGQTVDAWFTGITSVLYVMIMLTLAWAVLEARGLADPAGHPIFFASVSTILAGADWGDHCSPISDTTAISSLASQCDVIDHVNTHVPYALLVGAIAIVLGLLPVGLGLPWWSASRSLRS